MRRTLALAQPTADTVEKNEMVLDVQILYTEGCANTPQTVQRVSDVAQNMGMAVRINQILIASQKQADELHFLGSPTVQINGQDTDPAARTATAFGFT